MKRSWQLGRAAGPALLLLLCACASPEVQVGATFDPLERFPAEATWRWDEPANLSPSDERVGALGVVPMLREIVTRELLARGYAEARSAKPDYLLSYQLNTATRIRAEGDSFSIASLSVLLADPDSKRRLWVGFARAQVDVKRSPEERRARMEQAVNGLLRDFPPR